LWALAIIARPYTWWRILLVIIMAASFSVVLVIRPLQIFFQLDLVGVTAPGAAAAIGVLGAVLLEVFAVLLRQRGGAAI
jgi:cation-transporting ATPase E